MKCISPNLKNLRKGVLAYWYIPREEREKFTLISKMNTPQGTRTMRPSRSGKKIPTFLLALEDKIRELLSASYCLRKIQLAEERRS